MSAPTSGYIDNEAQAAYPPNPELDTGAEFHSCEHCKDFTLDFGLTDEELDEMLRNRTKESLTAMELATTRIQRVNMMREMYGSLATFNDTKDQVAQKANTGCKFYAWLLLATGYPENDTSGISWAFFNLWSSSLGIVHVGTPIDPKKWIKPCVPRDNPLAEVILNRLPAVDPWSEITKAQVTQWMEDCSDTCEMRRNEEAFFSPAYLIELSPCMSKCPWGSPSDCCGFTLRLTKDIQGPVSYAALSYCWGGDQHFKTTKSNIHNLLCNIPYTDMPATLKDAAKVAFDLNFQFLWIDALCLIQDPGEDEIHTMIAEIPNIYRHATLTIAAKSSKSVNEGFLHPRHVKDFSVKRDFTDFGLYDFRIAIKNLTGKSGFATIPTYDITDRELFPVIETRGWTLQEQVLSKRYLSFSNTATRWQFYGINSDGSLLADGGNIPKGIASSDFISFGWKGLQFSKSHKTTRGYKQLWYDLLFQYMQRELSMRKDRPIAISALASDIGDANNYVAGIWLSDLCQGLSWIPDSPQKEAVVGCYAPSWSWWSAATALLRQWPPVTTPFVYHEPQFRLVDYHVELSHPSAPFGYVVEASLRVEARCARVLVSDIRSEWFNLTLGLKYGTAGHVCLTDRSKSGVLCDWKDGFVKGQVLYLLVLFISRAGMTRICGLILTGVEDNESEQDRKFRRVGAFDINWWEQDDHMTFVEWVGKQPVETLTLV